MSHDDVPEDERPDLRLVTMSFDAQHVDRARRREDRSVRVHPSWAAFIRHCRELEHGEVHRLVIQDGVPVLAEVTTKKVKFSR